MDPESSVPGEPGDASSTTAPVPLQPVSHNQQSLRNDASAAGRDSLLSVTDKINQFNTLAKQSKELERKTADAALKRAMLGREEAETEMRRYRDEARLLRKQLEEGKDRERKVGERLETVMENYGRAKETHAHTQALWEKEIRRARKETFKAQSTTVKLQEELKAARDAQKAAEEALEREKERSKAREQEAFSARYSLVGLQEQLDQALEQAKTLEQERDAFQTLARNKEDVERIAAEGRLPLPRSSEADDDEFASPRKPRRVSSINLADVRSSAASEAEIEELTGRWLNERQRADRALQMVEFLQAECQLKVCSCAKSLKRRLSDVEALTPRRKRHTAGKITDAADAAILSEMVPTPAQAQENLSPRRSKTDMLREREAAARQEGHKPRLSTVFIPEEGIFRTVSVAEAQVEVEVKAKAGAEEVDAAAPVITVTANATSEQTTFEEATEAHAETESEPEQARRLEKDLQPLSPSTDGGAEEVHNVTNPLCYARTPSVEPPTFAAQRTSLLSLLDAPHQHELLAQYQAASAVVAFNIPTVPGPAPEDIPVPASTLSARAPEGGEMGEEDEHTIYHSTASQHAQANSLDSVDAAPEIFHSAATSHRTSRRDYDAHSAVVDRDEGRTISRPVTPLPDAASVFRPYTSLTHHEHLGKENMEPTHPADDVDAAASVPPPFHRPHTSAACYAGVKTVTTTTKVPLREETADPSLASRLLAAQMQRTPRKWGAAGDDGGPSFDPSNTAFTPTMTREQALAQIRERRGRARSVGKGVDGAAAAAVTPRKQMVQGVVRRDVSAPTGTGAKSGGRGSAARAESVGRRVRT